MKSQPCQSTRTYGVSRARTSKATQMWNHQDDIAEFRPERWLKVNAKGELWFDGRAAPLQTFGVGVRSCYGRKLAYLEMRVIHALIVWNFELLPIPDSLIEWRVQDVLTHQVQNSRVRLAEITI
ncbi:hypothetical protein AC578_3713 [Pseudocercospora eumusae]|uniref:Cytochrome P450 n=1 Tax=Pseudocercospora eumusae TaxID=321146 RepID=A0A139HSU5_9PEZI|nr:hypothetical protein AC578_3713 [Pseudocercospora eumusae]